MKITKQIIELKNTISGLKESIKEFKRHWIKQKKGKKKFANRSVELINIPMEVFTDI